MEYTTNNEINTLIETTISRVMNKETEGLTRMIKTAPTWILLADENHNELRFRPGNELHTYTGVNEKGEVIDETWGSPVLKENSVILTNKDPIKYPEGHSLAGEIVKGFYDNLGRFIINQDKGNPLFNEYFSDIEYVLEHYGIKASTEWQIGFKLDPSYVIEIPQQYGEIKLKLKNGAEETIKGGDYIVIDTRIKKEKVQITSVHGVAREWLEKTYMDFEEYLNKIKN